MKTPKPSTELDPPDHLRTAGRELWTRVCHEYGITDSGGLALLGQACDAVDRASAAREQLQRDGLTVPDARGGIRAHPANAIEQGAWSAVRAALRQLRLDIDIPPAKTGRPATRR